MGYASYPWPTVGYLNLCDLLSMSQGTRDDARLTSSLAKFGAEGINCDFVPTGLAVGRMLASVDVGRPKSDGARMLAQWKKSPYPIALDNGFIEAISDLGKMAFTVPMPVAPVISPKH